MNTLSQLSSNEILPAGDSEPQDEELEKFRRQWKAELSHRSAGPSSAANDSTNSPAQKTSTTKTTQPPKSQLQDHDEYSGSGITYHDLATNQPSTQNASSSLIGDPHTAPITALDHYELAVSYEDSGRLGESLQHYRTAFKLDDNVGELYKIKHYASVPQKPPVVSFPQPRAEIIKRIETHQDAKRSHAEGNINLSEMIQTFADAQIVGSAPPSDASPAPPCPIAILPNEILSMILRQIALRNVAAFSRMSLVCKRLAYLITKEDHIWKDVALSSEQGFGDMHYKFTCNEFGEALPSEQVDKDKSNQTTFTSLSEILLKSHYLNSWRQMYRHRPRLRFHGVYISTINYTRPAGPSVSLNTWSTPIVIVTYYRYLRFYRDGTVISLLTTFEPTDVVHILTKENLPALTLVDNSNLRRRVYDQSTVMRTANKKMNVQNNNKIGPAQVTASQKSEITATVPATKIMKDALRGRWRLTGPDCADEPETSAGDKVIDEVEGDVHIETEGVIPKYLYKLQLALGSLNSPSMLDKDTIKSKGSRNNRLLWRGFWSYDRLVDDWSEFNLKEYRPYYFSRVKSYGLGL